MVLIAERWRECVDRGASIVEGLPLPQAASLIPILLDSVHRDAAARLVESLPDAMVAADPALSYGRATVLARNDPGLAMGWLLRAHALADSGNALLAARVARDLGALHLSRGEDSVAQAVFEWSSGLLGRRGKRSADLLQLAGLLADHAGDGARARLMNERSVEASAMALTPMTRAVGLSNLAAAGTHRDPRSSIALCRHALAVVAAEQLHPSAEAAIRNVLGYALIPVGDLAGARRELSLAAELAADNEYLRVALFARFNLSILAELDGDLSTARRDLSSLRADALRHGHRDLVQWASVRSHWLAYRAGLTAWREALQMAALESLSMPQQRAIRIIEAIGGIRGGGSARDLVHLASEAVASDDRLEAFALQLQIASREQAAGRERSARRWARAAESLAVGSGLRLSTNWWEPDLVDVAMVHDEGHGLAARLHRPPAATRRPNVRIAADGDLEIDGRPTPEIWREGRTGSRVLRRFFQALVHATPDPLRRDSLCDLLWPESDGDRAVQDLYAATDDLRRALRAAPGVRLVTEAGTYRLDIAPWVTIAS